MMADDNKPIHELRFDAAVKVIQSLPADGKNIRKTKFELQESLDANCCRSCDLYLKYNLDRPAFSEACAACSLQDQP